MPDGPRRQAVLVPAVSNAIARWSAAARRSSGSSPGPPSACALMAAWAASSTTPPTRTARSGVRWKTSTPWFASSTAGTPGRTAARMLATACSEPRGPYAAIGTPSASPNIARASIQQAIGRLATANAVAYGECVWTTQPTSGRSWYMAVCIATTAPWIGGSLPSRSVPSSATRAIPSDPSPFSDDADVKYISSAPGTRRLTLPCPLAETAPLASTLAAVPITWSTRFLSIAVSPLWSARS